MVLRNQTAQIHSSSENIEPIADIDLQNICNYYLNCIMEESRNSVSQFLTGEFGSDMQ